MDKSNESFLTLTSGKHRASAGEEEGYLLAGVAQAVPATLLPTVSLPFHLPARRLPQPATASLRCGLPAQDHTVSRPGRWGAEVGWARLSWP